MKHEPGEPLYSRPIMLWWRLRGWVAWHLYEKRRLKADGWVRLPGGWWTAGPLTPIDCAICGEPCTTSTLQTHLWNNHPDLRGDFPLGDTTQTEE